MRRPLVVLATAVTALIAGCSVQPVDVGVTADCDEGDGHVNPLLVLMAQAVPTAELVPCIGAVPSAWRRGPVDVEKGRGAFAFVPSSVEGPGEAVLSVVLTDACDASGATEVPSDEPGTRRYERLRDVGQGYEGERLYVYDGGCTTLDFRLPGQNRAQQVGEASLAVSFVSRDELRDGVRKRSDGRLQLDQDEDAP
jgi:hypothetical protein